MRSRLLVTVFGKSQSELDEFMHRLPWPASVGGCLLAFVSVSSLRHVGMEPGWPRMCFLVPCWADQTLCGGTEVEAQQHQHKVVAAVVTGVSASCPAVTVKVAHAPVHGATLAAACQHDSNLAAVGAPFRIPWVSAPVCVLTTQVSHLFRNVLENQITEIPVP